MGVARGLVQTSAIRSTNMFRDSSFKSVFFWVFFPTWLFFCPQETFPQSSGGDRDRDFSETIKNVKKKKENGPPPPHPLPLQVALPFGCLGLFACIFCGKLHTDIVLSNQCCFVYKRTKARPGLQHYLGLSEVASVAEGLARRTPGH